MDFIISKKISNDRLYAYAKNRFWAWDAERLVWKESHLLSKKFDLNREVDKLLTPEQFLNESPFSKQNPMLFDPAVIEALEAAEPCKNAPLEPVKENPVSQNIAAQCGNIISATTAPSFNFDVDEQTNALLLQDAQTFISGTMARVMAAKHAHDLCANNKNGTWGKWCEAVGISRDTGDRMASVAEQFGNIQLEGKSILDVQPMKLLYAGAKASTPTVIKEAIASGDITSYKEYQELLAQLKAKDEALAAAEKRAEDAEAQESEATDSRAEAWAQTDAAEQKRKQLQSDYNDVLKENQQLRTDRVNAMNEADRAKVRLEEAHDAMQAAENARDAALADVQGLSEQNRKLKAENADLKRGVTVTAVVDEEEVDRRAAEKAWGLADARNAELQAEKDKVEQRNSELEQQLAEALAAKQDTPYDPTEDIEAVETCIVNIDGTYSMARPILTRLVGTGEDFNRTAHALISLCDRIHAECVKMIIKNDKETLYE